MRSDHFGFEATVDTQVSSVLTPLTFANARVSREKVQFLEVPSIIPSLPKILLICRIVFELYRGYPIALAYSAMVIA